MFNKMYDIITFGSAAQDIHLKSKTFKVLEDKENFGPPFGSGKGICMPFGSKIDVDDISFTSGGGGTNTAATFAKQGFKVAFCGAIGADAAGLEIVRELKSLRIDTKFLIKNKEAHTNQSVIVSCDGQDRTILVYRGASEMISKEDIPWQKLKSRWFYFAPMSGSLCDSSEDMVNLASQNKIKVAINPSKQQLSLPETQIKNILQKTDVLFLNQEEASFLTKIPFDKEGEIFKKLDEMCPGVAVMTKGASGVVASDGKHIYSAKPDPSRKIADATGAGDSFAAGFLSDFIKSGGDIEKAIQLGLANSAANLAVIGAKTGILERGADFTRVTVDKKEL